jgi:dsRNA-specific ribonuclease
MEHQDEIYNGPRDEQFKMFILELLTKANIQKKYAEALLSESNLKLLGQSFTAVSADPDNNYEMFEQMGDLTVNKFVVWYMYRRFPFLMCPKGVKVVARLRINYGSKESLADIADKLGFWPFISAAVEGNTKNTKYKNRHKKDLLEDTFEAFIGCIELILDCTFRTGVGYGVTYGILSNIFDEIKISLAYDDLFDAKTRLKEIFDCYPDIGTWSYTNRREEIDQEGHSISISSLYLVPKGASKTPPKQITGPNNNDFIELPQKNWQLISEGRASTKSLSQQKAAEIGIEVLRQRGYTKETPSEYKIFTEKA